MITLIIIATVLVLGIGAFIYFEKKQDTQHPSPVVQPPDVDNYYKQVMVSPPGGTETFPQ